MAVRLAEARGATLVPVSLIMCEEKQRGSGVRLEHIQQSKDFLEFVRSTTERVQVPCEGHEVFTGDVVKCVGMLVLDLHCDGLIIVMSKQRGILLSTHEMASLVTCPPATLVLVRLVENQERKISVVKRFFVVARAPPQTIR
jgi:hypothetical protein